MADDNDPPKNPFVRWKQLVDAHIGMTLQGLLGIPNMVSKNFNLGGDDGKGSGSGSGAAGGAPPPPPPSSNPPPAPSAPSSSQASRTSSAGGSGDALDGVDAAQLLAWHKFIYYSPYSPLKLQQQQQLGLLPPPVPQDVPFGADPFAFTYADAFEDLLRAGSGRPLLDLADRAYRNLRYQLRYGSAVEPPYALFHRMHSQRLLDAYFPRSGAAAPGSDGEEHGGLAGTPNNDDVVRAVTALAERDRDLWREQRAEEDDDGPDSDTGVWDDDAADDDAWRPARSTGTPASRSYGYGGSLFGELDRVFRVLSRIIDEDTGAADDGSKAGSTPGSTPASHADKKEADAEDELYDVVRSAYADAERSLSALVRSFAGGGFASPASSASSTTTTTMTTSGRADADDGRPGETIQTTEEHTDAFGNRHVKTVVQRLDADGNEVARETRYTVRSPAAYGDGDSVGSDDSDGDGSQAAEKTAATPKPSNDAAKSSGWFWK